MKGWRPQTRRERDRATGKSVRHDRSRPMAAVTSAVVLEAELGVAQTWLVRGGCSFSRPGRIGRGPPLNLFVQDFSSDTGLAVSSCPRPRRGGVTPPNHFAGGDSPCPQLHSHPSRGVHESRPRAQVAGRGGGGAIADSGLGRRNASCPTLRAREDSDRWTHPARAPPPGPAPGA